MRNLGKVLFEIADKATAGTLQNVVLRVDSLVALDASENFLGQLPGAFVLYDITSDSQIEKIDRAEQKFLIAYISHNEKQEPDYEELVRFAREHNAPLVCLDLHSDFADDEFTGAKVIRCRTEFALTAGKLLEQLEEDDEIADNVIVYNESNWRGIRFAIPEVSRQIVHKNGDITVEPAIGWNYNAYTVREFADFVRTLDKDAMLELDGRWIVFGVTTYKGPATHISMLSASTESGLAGLYTKHYNDLKKKKNNGI